MDSRALLDRVQARVRAAVARALDAPETAISVTVDLDHHYSQGSVDVSGRLTARLISRVEVTLSRDLVRHAGAVAGARDLATVQLLTPAALREELERLRAGLRDLVRNLPYLDQAAANIVQRLLQDRGDP